MTLNKLEAFKERLVQKSKNLDPTLKSKLWSELKEKITHCSYSTEVLLEYLPPKLMLLVILAAPEVVVQNFKLLLGELLKKSPDSFTIQLLKNFNQKDLYPSLAPYLYLSDVRGSRAVFLCAKLGITIDKDCYAHLLTSRKWTRDDLLNLVFLVKPEQRTELVTVLDNEKTKDLTAMTAVTFDEFSHLLLQGIMTSPVLPQLTDIAYKQPDLNKINDLLNSQNLEQNDIGNAAEQASKIVQPSLTKLQQRSPNKLSPKSKPRSKKQKAQIKPSPAPINFVLAVLSGIAIIFLLCWFFPSSQKQITTQDANSHLPELWTDAATNRPVTQAFLRADKDYRMGELYLTRDKYAEALKMFEDALSIDASHASALFRAGFCRMMLDDLVGAKKKFKKLLKMHHNFKNANLYLARIAIKNNNHELAIHHYENEFANATTPNIGLEYASFLDYISKTEKAGIVINKLQEQFPQQMLISTSGKLRKPDMGRLSDE